MEESSGNFSAVFNAKKSTICLHEAEIEITNGKCLIKGQAAFLREKCPTGISFRTSSGQDGTKHTDFIIPQEVQMNKVTPPAAAAAAPAPHSHRATSPQPAASTSNKQSIKRPHKKTRKQASILQYVNK